MLFHAFLQVLVFVDGIDAMTSRHMSARTAYPSTDIILNQVRFPWCESACTQMFRQSGALA